MAAKPRNQGEISRTRASFFFEYVFVVRTWYDEYLFYKLFFSHPAYFPTVFFTSFSTKFKQFCRPVVGEESHFALRSLENETREIFDNGKVSMAVVSLLSCSLFSILETSARVYRRGGGRGAIK